jgi:hypothetical protein
MEAEEFPPVDAPSLLAEVLKIFAANLKAEEATNRNISERLHGSMILVRRAIMDP